MGSIAPLPNRSLLKSNLVFKISQLLLAGKEKVTLKEASCFPSSQQKSRINIFCSTSVQTLGDRTIALEKRVNVRIGHELTQPQLLQEHFKTRCEGKRLNEKTEEDGYAHSSIVSKSLQP